MDETVKDTRVGLVLETLRFLDKADDLIGVDIWSQNCPWNDEIEVKASAVRNYIEPFITHFNRLVKETGITSNLEWEKLLKSENLMTTGSIETIYNALGAVPERKIRNPVLQACQDDINLNGEKEHAIAMWIFAVCSLLHHRCSHSARAAMFLSEVEYRPGAILTTFPRTDIQEEEMLDNIVDTMVIEDIVYAGEVLSRASRRWPTS